MNLAREPQAFLLPYSVNRLEINSREQGMHTPKTIARMFVGEAKNLLAKVRIALLVVPACLARDIDDSA